MLTFTTLYFGLVAGPQPVELVADAAVARIELFVGSAPCATLTAPPWRARCDFGPLPEPRRLVAVGRDEKGQELERAERIVNLFRAAAEVDIHLDRTAAGGRRARLVADSLAGGPPRSTRVELDGVPLAAPDPSAIELPAVDEGIPHLLRAELDWSDTVTASGEAVFGGENPESVSSELTAVAIEDRRVSERTSGRGPTVAELDGAFATAAGPARAVAVDEGPAELFVVFDPAAIAPLAQVSTITARVPVDGFTPGQPVGVRQSRWLGGADQRFVYTLERADRIRMMWPWPERRESAGRMVESFPPSPPYTSTDGGLIWILVRAHLPANGNRPPALADAAAVAGMIAQGRGRRRAVLVVLGARDLDQSQLDPASLHAYLAAVGVPLFVWRAEKRKGEGTDPWGKVTVLGSSSELRAAVRALKEELAQQRIVWIDGSHLPNEVQLVSSKSDFRIAGAIEP